MHRHLCLMLCLPIACLCAHVLAILLISASPHSSSPQRDRSHSSQLLPGSPRVLWKTDKKVSSFKFEAPALTIESTLILRLCLRTASSDRRANVIRPYGLTFLPSHVYRAVVRGRTTCEEQAGTCGRASWLRRGPGRLGAVVEGGALGGGQSRRTLGWRTGRAAGCFFGRRNDAS